jgi:hypothetical protein
MMLAAVLAFCCLCPGRYSSPRSGIAMAALTPPLPAFGNIESRCRWEVDEESVPDIVVEVFSDRVSSSSHILGYGPAEVSGALQHVTVYFTAPDLETIKNLTLKAWANCHPVGSPMACEQLMTSESAQSGELFVYAINSWKGGHENRMLLQLFDTHNAIVAQGKASFVLEAISNKTEGIMQNLVAASAQHQIEACSDRILDSGDRCWERRGGGAHSTVAGLEWKELVCSQPRAPLRLYHVSMLQFSRGRVHLWLPPKLVLTALALSGEGVEGGEAGEAGEGSGGDGDARVRSLSEEGFEVGMIHLHAHSRPPQRECHPMYRWPIEGTGDEEEHEEISTGGGRVAPVPGLGGVGVLRVGLLAVGVTGGSIEHLGHFLLDYLANLYRMQQAFRSARGGATQDEGSIEWLCLVDDMRAGLDDLPARRFYSLVSAVCREAWVSLGELPDKTCLDHVVVGFGALETIRSSHASSVPRAVHTETCKVVVLDLQHRILRSLTPPLFPRELPRGTGRLVYLSRTDTAWRRLLNEEELVGSWNQAHAATTHLHIHTVQLHTMPIREQLLLLQDTRVMIGLNASHLHDAGASHMHDARASHLLAFLPSFLNTALIEA